MIFRKSWLLLILIFSFLSMIFLYPNSSYALKTTTFQQKNFILICEEPLESIANRIIKLYPILKIELEETFGWPIHFRSTILLIYNNNTFQKIAGNNFIVAFAKPDESLIVIDYSKMKTDPFTIEGTLKHELCHLLLNHYIDRSNLPRWLDEGIAQWVSGGLADILMVQNKSALHRAILSDRIIDIRKLSTHFPVEQKEMGLAYIESKSLVEYIVGEYGLEGLLELLEYLKNRDDFDTAVIKSLSISVDELIQEWVDHLKRRITWFYFFTNYLYETLFFIAALLLIYGFIRLFLKKKQAFKDYGEDSDNNVLH